MMKLSVFYPGVDDCVELQGQVSELTGSANLDQRWDCCCIMHAEKVGTKGIGSPPCQKYPIFFNW